MFSPYEGSLRVPFLIRYPGKIPARQVSNDIVHLVDVFPTLANFVGGEIPQDRILDGVDQSDFLMGKSEKSARESIVIYIGNELFGVKWRNWKMLIKEIDEDSYAIQNMAYPSIYNLIVDPKEEEPENFYLDDTWVDAPLWQVIEGPLRSQGVCLRELVLPLPHVSKIDRKRRFHKRDCPKDSVAYYQRRSKILSVLSICRTRLLLRLWLAYVLPPCQRRLDIHSIRHAGRPGTRSTRRSLWD